MYWRITILFSNTDKDGGQRIVMIGRRIQTSGNSTGEQEVDEQVAAPSEWENFRVNFLDYFLFWVTDGRVLLLWSPHLVRLRIGKSLSSLSFLRFFYIGGHSLFYNLFRYLYSYYHYVACKLSVVLRSRMKNTCQEM